MSMKDGTALPKIRVGGGLVSFKWLKDQNTPGTAGGPGGRDRTLAVKCKKIA